MTLPKPTSSTLGFVGLGTMGGRMVRRFLDTGYRVVGHNRTRSRGEWLVAAGMTWAESPQAVAEEADVVFSMVANDEALTAVTLGANGLKDGLSSGKIYVDMSTVSPNTIREVAAVLADTGAEMLEAPVSGSTAVVEQGKLVFMVGGTEATLEKVKPFLHELGPSITFLGPIGHAATMKLAINLCIPIQLIAMYEGVLLAEKGGIPRETAINMIANSAAGSLAMKYRGPLALSLPEEPTFNVNMMQKDTRLALALGRELEVPLLTVGLSNELLTAARSLGFGEEDFAALFQTLAKISGVE